MKKCLLALVIAAVAAGGAFAQNNTVTVDIGPTIVGGAIKSMGNAISEGQEGVSSSGFGIGAQYERQLFEELSVAGRFAYVGGGLGVSEEDGSLKATAKMKLNSFSLEAHARYFPFSKRMFFLDGMLGYAYMGLILSGDVIVEENGYKEKDGVDFSVSRSYFKLGAKIGWRIDFGAPGGFVFEPSFGYSAAIGIGDKLGKKLANKISGELGDAEAFDDIFKYVEMFGLGGPRLSLAFGWRF